MMSSNIAIYMTRLHAALLEELIAKHVLSDVVDET